MYSRAVSMPPISSTTRSLRSTMSPKSPRLRVSTPTTSGRLPVVASIAPARSSISRCSAAPTVPWPRMPTLKRPLDPSPPCAAGRGAAVESAGDDGSRSGVTGGEIVVGLAANHDASLAARAEDHGRARDAVVVVGHRVTVGAGDGRDQHVARPRVVEQHVRDEDVARLAVLPGHRAVVGAAEA